MPQISIRTEDDRIHYDMSGDDHPCVGCGACCKFFRVSFYHGELDTQPGGCVPAELTTQVTPFRACMQGTEAGNAPCVALDGDGRCGIYERRPSVCREFPALMEDGSLNPECIRLKTLFGLMPGTQPDMSEMPPGGVMDDTQRAA